MYISEFPIVIALSIVQWVGIRDEITSILIHDPKNIDTGTDLQFHSQKIYPDFSIFRGWAGIWCSGDLFLNNTKK